MLHFAKERKDWTVEQCDLISQDLSSSRMMGYM